MTAERYVDPSLEDAFMGWLVWAPTPILAPWLARLRPELVTDGRRRVMLEAVVAHFAATGQNDPAMIYQRLRADGADIHAGVLQQWSDAYAGCPGSGYGLLEALEDLAKQRAARMVRETPPQPTGDASLRVIGEALEEAATPLPVPTVTLDTLGKQGLAGLDEARPRSLRTGLGALDRTLGGFLPGQLVIVGGRTGAGKSVFGLRLGRGLAEQAGRPCYVHALEMTAAELAARLAADHAAVENWRIQHGTFQDAGERERVGFAYKALRQSQALHIRDLRGGASFPAALAAYEAWLAQHPDAVALVVDYLGLYRDIPGAERRYQELGIVAHALKALAGRYGIVVIAVSQLSRAAAGEAPQLHHLRESGDLEQDADVVLLLEAAGDDWLDVHIAKCRAGVAGDVVRLGFTRAYCRIEDAA